MIIKQIGVWFGRVMLGLIIIWCLLLWIDRQTDKREKSAFKQGYSQCETEFAKKEVCLINSKLESVKNENIKKAVIGATRAIDDDATQRLYDNEIL